LIIVETKDTLLICKKGCSQDVRKVIDTLEAAKKKRAVGLYHFEIKDSALNGSVHRRGAHNKINLFLPRMFASMADISSRSGITLYTPDRPLD
jgi:hypothetical protein